MGASLTETEEEGVHTHAKNAEEATGDDIGPQDGGLEDKGPLGFFWGVRSMRQRRGVTHHDGQPVIIEVGALKVFTQPWDATSEKEEGQDPCGRGLEVSITSLKSSLQLPSTRALCPQNFCPGPYRHLPPPAVSRRAAAGL